jgi:hypothetical protein
MAHSLMFPALYAPTGAWRDNSALILRGAREERAPQDEVTFNPHGEERSNAARLDHAT